MSAAKLRSTTALDGLIEFATTDTTSAPAQPTGDILARYLLNQVLTPSLRRLLKSPSRLILIKTRDEGTAYLIEGYLAGMARAPVVEAYTEVRKSGGQLKPQGRVELDKLQYGRSVILISQDPDRLLVPEARIGADAVIIVPPPSLATIRKTIRTVTGGFVRDLRSSDIEGLTLFDLKIGIRPGLSARQCVLNLRRAAAVRHNQPASDNAIPVVPLERLALTRPVADWATNNLRIMEQIADGRLDPASLRFGCLEGPPGTGKTTLVASLAHSAGWRFLETSVASWFSRSGGHLGDVIRVAQAFFDEIALSEGPVVGLMDEIESLPSRSAMEPKDAQWWTPVVTFVLTEIDRIRKSGRPVLLVGATNHHDRLDPALVRAGRLEHRVSVLPPDEEERRDLFISYLGNHIGDSSLAVLARLSIGATPAQIESWCTSAQAAADVENRDLALADLLSLVAPPSGRSPQNDWAVAVHEAGHAVVALELGLPVSEISILAMGSAAGWVNTSIKDRLLSRRDVEELAVMTLAGRAADEILGHGANAGAESDIRAVNGLIRRAMLEHGLYGSLATADNTDLHSWREGISLWSTINAELDRFYNEAVEIVTRRQSDILRLVDILLVERVITGERLAEVVSFGLGAQDGGLDDLDGPNPT